MRVLALCFLLYGCGGGHSLTTGPVTDLGGPTTDFSTPADMTFSSIGIQCGTTPCAANAQFCCTSDSGKTGMCGFGDDAANCNGSRFYCDGPEDCPPASPYCCISDGVAECRDSQCPGDPDTGVGLCHQKSDCAKGNFCCSSTETPYELCLTSCP